MIETSAQVESVCYTATPYSAIVCVVYVAPPKWCCSPSWCIAVVTCMSDQEASVSVSSTKRCSASRCMYQYRRRSTSAQEASVSSTKRCPPSRCISTAVVTCRSTTKHMLGRRYHSPGRTYITCWAVIPFTAAESIGHTACGSVGYTHLT